MDYQKIGDLISKLRKEKGLTQKELADKLFITDRAVSKWERGLGCPDVSLLDDLSKILDISIIEILKGRRLDKDEIIENASIIESMNYSKENFKYKFRKYFNIFCILVILFIGLIIVINNIQSIYYLNKTYKNTVNDQGLKELISETNSNINIIKNNKGKYTDEEYDKILTYVESIETDIKNENNLYYVDKVYYSYSDLVKFYETHQRYEYVVDEFDDSYTVGTKDIYQILLTHDYNIIESITSYYGCNASIDSTVYYFYNMLENPYINNKKIDSFSADMINGYLVMRYYRDNNLLLNIIEVGDLHE